MDSRRDDQELKIVRRELTPAAWDMLKAAHAPPALAEENIRGEIEAGRMALLSGEIAGRQVFVMLVRTEDLIDGGRELAVPAVAASDARVWASCMDAAVPALEAEVAPLGYSSVLYRTRSPAVAKRLCLMGYEFVESTFRKELR